MTLERINSYQLAKCYAIGEITIDGRKNYLVAAEKQDACLLFDEDGNYIEKIWDNPGGTMSIVSLDGNTPAFLATHRFYSPNDSAEAKIVISFKENGTWKTLDFAYLPFVHRFDILQRDGKKFLTACTIKSKHEYKDDWNHPGAIYVAEMPDDPISFAKEGKVLCMKAEFQGLTHNHGFFKMSYNGFETALIASDEGVFNAVPPSKNTMEWKLEKLIDEASSDMISGDFDGDGENEILTIAPFHGEKIRIYKKKDGNFTRVWECERNFEFSHAIEKVRFNGKDYAFIGARKGGREIASFYGEDGVWKYNILADNLGSANFKFFETSDGPRLIATNREIDEIDFYKLV